MSVDNEAKVSDGRRARSERSQAAIIDACLSLMNEGILVPTAQQISDRAEVGIRSFFRHFNDMDTLFNQVDQKIREDYESLFRPESYDGALEDRIVGMVTLFSNGWEQLTNMILSTKAMRWRSAALRKNYARNQRALSEEVGRWLPEAAALPRSDRVALDAVISFEFWERLREHQDLSKKVSREIVISMVSGFFGR